MTTNSTSTAARNALFIWWNGDVVVVHGVRTLQGAAGTVFMREARKLQPVPAFPINSRGVESPELDWLPGTGAFYLSEDRAEQVTQLLEYIDCM